MLEKYLREQGVEPSELEEAKKQSRVYDHRPDYTWGGVEVSRYKPAGDNWNATIRQVLIGYREDTKFHLRYFEISPGGYSSLEKHVHSHAVTVIRGRGKAIVGDRAVDLGYLDTVYVSPDTPHQFINDSDEPFGFLCVVDAERDVPRDLDPEELAGLKSNPNTKDVVQTGKVEFLTEK